MGTEIVLVAADALEEYSEGNSKDLDSKSLGKTFVHIEQQQDSRSLVDILQFVDPAGNLAYCSLAASGAFANIEAVLAGFVAESAFEKVGLR